MSYLGDYLGQLLSEITIARMHADLESIRVAELYSSHPLLRTMPIPHFRLPDVELEVPVVIKQMAPLREGGPARGGIDVKTLRKSFDGVLTLQLRKAGIQMSAEQTKSLQASIERALGDQELPLEISVDSNRIADYLADAVFKTLSAKAAPDDSERLAQIQKLASELRTAARTAFLKSRLPPPRLTALVTTQDIREAGAAENITRLRLKITEESVEWTTVESGGQTQDRLVPE